jgi:hypothetical protein
MEEIETIVKKYPRHNSVFMPLRDIIFEPGTRDDWEELHELHYKATNSTMGRYYRAVLNKELIGICVMSAPRGLLSQRHEMFPNIKPGTGDTKITNVYRFKWLNDNVSLNSRTVVDTMYRGVGIAYRLLNLASRVEGKRLVEIQSSMSRYNLFAQKAGFKFAKPRMAPNYEEGLEFFRNNFKSNPADYVAICQEYENLPEKMQKVIGRKTREFYYQRSSLEQTGKNRGVGMVKVNEMPFPVVMKNLQQLVFATPLYGVYENPDFGRVLPKTMPLIWFDRQPTDKPLIVD